MYKIFAWGQGYGNWSYKKMPFPAEAINEDRDKIPGLGIIHRNGTYHLARPGDMAIVEYDGDIDKVLETPEVWSRVILGDEVDVDQPWSVYRSPEGYREWALPLYERLRDAGVEVGSFGLAGSTRASEYIEKRIGNTVQGVNYSPSQTNWWSIRNLMNRHDGFMWFPTMIPYITVSWTKGGFFKRNSLLSFILQMITIPGVVRQFKILMNDHRTLGVGVWALRNYSGSVHWHGLLDHDGNHSWLSRRVKRILET